MLEYNDCQKLLDKLCIDLGFCLPPSKAQDLVNNPPMSVGEFTNAVFIVEGLNPELADRRLYRQVRDRIQNAVFDAYN
jgi:hypothetical protein